VETNFDICSLFNLPFDVWYRHIIGTPDNDIPKSQTSVHTNVGDAGSESAMELGYAKREAPELATNIFHDDAEAWKPDQKHHLSKGGKSDFHQLNISARPFTEAGERVVCWGVEFK